MEPAVIDWKNIDSRFVMDELLEEIDAPQWVDFSAPDQYLASDDAWFCRPDCKHPKIGQDFKNSKTKVQKSAGVSPARVVKSRGVMNDGDLKRRAGLTAAFSSFGHQRPKPSRKFGGEQNDENENPNSAPFVSAAKVLKDAVKSSAEKKKTKKNTQPFPPQPVSGQTPSPLEKNKFSPVLKIEEAEEGRATARTLKSTASARNLLGGGGREIVNQVAEFWAELKRMATGGSTSENEQTAKKMVETAPLIPPSTQKEATTTKRSSSPLLTSPSSRQKTRSKKAIKGDEENINRPQPVNVMKVSREKSSQIRSCPPTPQKIPSPSGRFKHHKPATTAASPPSNPTDPQRLVEEFCRNCQWQRNLPMKMATGLRILQWKLLLRSVLAGKKQGRSTIFYGS